MSLRLRPLALPEDLERMAELLTASRLEEVTPELLREREERLHPMAGLRLAAVDSFGHMAGFGQVLLLPGRPDGRYELTIAVEPSGRSNGMGTALLEELERFAKGQGANWLHCEVRDDDPAALAFMQHWGYVVERHLYQSCLSLAAFRGDGLPDSVPGIRFFTLAAERSERLVRQLYDLTVLCQADNPAHEEQEPPFRVWRETVLDAGWLPADGFVLAADGDRLVGMTALEPLHHQTVHSVLTGVHPEYRNRGIALALKLRAIAIAGRWGASSIIVRSDAANGPMLAVNRKLGYQPQPGYFHMAKVL